MVPSAAIAARRGEMVVVKGQEGIVSSSLSISIFFIGVLIHLISISILLDNYVIIKSKSDSTCK